MATPTAADVEGDYSDLTGIIFHRHSVEVVDRPEGYREFRCLPGTWSYAEPRPWAALLTEFYSQRMDTDPHGYGESGEFWSGSDTALRLRALPGDDLALRELNALATRRETGLNAPKPWASAVEIASLAREWEPEATDIHVSQIPLRRSEKATRLWAQYGMTTSEAQPIITGYGMRKSVRQPLGRSGTVWAGGPGTWYSWSTIRSWKRWPRRQEAQPEAMIAEPGKLLLFISHRWESLDHPDPLNAQLLGLEVGLDLSLAAALLRLTQEEPPKETQSGLPEVIAEFLPVSLDRREITSPALQRWARDIEATANQTLKEKSFRRKARRLETPEVRPLLTRIRDLVLVWYDYASMLQAPRNPEEESEFRREILELNTIQTHGATVVIAGDSRYLSRAWCFLELCGGMRQRIVELTPSWGQTVGLGNDATRWASRSDQLIGALHTLGDGAIYRSGLEATHAEDLGAIARLLRELPATGLLETDDSDLIGGTVPTPFRDGAWMRVVGRLPLAPIERMLPPVRDHGRLPKGEEMSRADLHAGADAIAGQVGVWVYSLQKALALGWAARAPEMWQTLRAQLRASLLPENTSTALDDALSTATDPSVCCMWADSRALAEDGLGWTRIIPSTVRSLVIIAPSDVPELCRIYDRVVIGHVASGVPVITYAPDTGRTLIYQTEDTPNASGEASFAPRTEAFRADVLAVPRLRRSNAYEGRMLLAPGATRADLEVLAALRLDPASGFVGSGAVSEEAAAGGLGTAGDPIESADLLAVGEARVLAEARARSTTASWDEWCTPRLHQSAWRIGFAQVQLRIIDQLVRKAAAVSTNPFLRRKLIYLIVEDEKGYGLPRSILDDADTLIAMIRERRNPP